MKYEIPPWNIEDARVLSETQFNKHRVISFELPDAKPVLDKSQPIILDVYLRNPAKPMLIAHPVVGSKHNEIARFFAKAYCRIGWNAAVVHRAHHPMEGKNPEEFELLLQNLIYNDLQVEDFLRRKGLMDPRRAISFGASLGGVTNALLTNPLPYKGFVCVVSGGCIAEIMARSNDRDIGNWRAERIRELGYSGVEELEEKYRETIETDTLKLANRKANVLLFSALFDKVVPTRAQWQLYRAFGWDKPTFWFPSGHASIVLFVPLILPIMMLWTWYTVHLKR